MKQDFKSKWWASDWDSDIATLERWKAMRLKTSGRFCEWLDQHIEKLRQNMIERYGKTACKEL